MLKSSKYVSLAMFNKIKIKSHSEDSVLCLLDIVRGNDD